LFNPQGNFDEANTGWGHHADFGGQLTYVRNLAIGLGHFHARADIITRRWESGPWSQQFSAPLSHYADAPSVRIVRVHCGPVDNDERRAFLPKEMLWPHLQEWSRNIVEHYKKENDAPAATLAHYADGGYAAALFEEQTGIPFATFTLHSGGPQKLDALVDPARKIVADDAPHTAIHQLLQSFQFQARIPAERLSLANARTIVVSSSDEQRHQYQHFLYKRIAQGSATASADESWNIAGKITQIAPGIDGKIFNTSSLSHIDVPVIHAIDDAIARAIPLHRRKLPIVVIGGRLTQKKNHIAVLSTFSRCAHLRDNANLLIAVTGGPEAFVHPSRIFSGSNQASELEIALEMKKFIETYHMNGQCIIVPGLDNTQAQLSTLYRYLSTPERRGVFCNAALHEPFGLMAIEAAACGLPVVVTKNGGASAIFGSSDARPNCILIDPADHDEIADGLCRAIIPEEWEALRRRGTQDVAPRYSWDETAFQYLRQVIKTIAVAPRDLRVNANVSSISIVAAAAPSLQGHPVRYVSTALSPMFTRRHFYQKIESSRTAPDDWAYLAAVDIDGTMYHKNATINACRDLARTLQDRHIPLCYVTGANVASVLARIQFGEIPCPDAIFSSVGTQMYFNDGEDCFLLDDQLQNDPVSSRFDKVAISSAALSIAERLGLTNGPAAFGFQDAHATDVEEQWKISFQFNMSGATADRDAAAVHDTFVRELAIDPYPLKIVLCTHVASSGSASASEEKQFCLDILPCDKAWSVNQIISDNPRLRVLTAGDSGNDIPLLCDVDAPGVSVVVGNSLPELRTAVLSHAAVIQDSHHRAATTHKGHRRVFFMSDPETAGAGSISQGLDYLFRLNSELTHA
jgi:sucrose-phosphate synthase